MAIYLISHNIGYQFDELSYFINTYKSTKQLRDQYEFLLQEKVSEEVKSTIQPLFPITFNKINLKYGDKLIFQDLSFDIKKGEKVAVIGPSGCGKSTLLNLIYGDILSDSGQITFNNQKLEQDDLSNSIAYILQESYVFDGLSLEDNIALGKSIDTDKMNRVLNRVHLSSLKGQLVYNNQLSGGEKQRLEIARSLYHDSQLILADEVKSNLDKINAYHILDILLDLPQTLIEVIHHYDADSLARYDKVIDLS